jgi:hypothetical protein
VQVAHHFRDFTYNTDRKINLKRHCLPFEAWLLILSQNKYLRVSFSKNALWKKSYLNFLHHRLLNYYWIIVNNSCIVVTCYYSIIIVVTNPRIKWHLYMNCKEEYIVSSAKTEKLQKI